MRRSVSRIGTDKKIARGASIRVSNAFLYALIFARRLAQRPRRATAAQRAAALQPGRRASRGPPAAGRWPHKKRGALLRGAAHKKTKGRASIAFFQCCSVRDIADCAQPFEAKFIVIVKPLHCSPSAMAVSILLDAQDVGVVASYFDAKGVALVDLAFRRGCLAPRPLM